MALNHRDNLVNIDNSLSRDSTGDRRCRGAGGNLGSVGQSELGCVDVSADSNSLAGGALIDSAGDNVLDSDSSLKSSCDCVVGCDGALIDGASHRNNIRDDGSLLPSAKRAVSNSGCAGRDGDNSGAVNNCSSLGIVGLTSSSLRAARNAGD